MWWYLAVLFNITFNITILSVNSHSLTAHHQQLNYPNTAYFQNNPGLTEPYLT